MKKESVLGLLLLLISFQACLQPSERLTEKHAFPTVNDLLSTRPNATDLACATALADFINTELPKLTVTARTFVEVPLHRERHWAIGRVLAGERSVQIGTSGMIRRPTDLEFEGRPASMVSFSIESVDGKNALLYVEYARTQGDSIDYQYLLEKSKTGWTIGRKRKSSVS